MVTASKGYATRKKMLRQRGMTSKVVCFPWPLGRKEFRFCPYMALRFNLYNLSRQKLQVKILTWNYSSLIARPPSGRTMKKKKILSWQPCKLTKSSLPCPLPRFSIKLVGCFLPWGSLVKAGVWWSHVVNGEKGSDGVHEGFLSYSSSIASAPSSSKRARSLASSSSQRTPLGSPGDPG